MTDKGLRLAQAIVVPCQGPVWAALSLVPAMTGDARRLLAGLVTRYTLEDPAGQWATSWDGDPLDRPGDLREERLPFREGVQRRLWGTGDHWELQWTGYPYPEDLATALTDPTVGVSGTRLGRLRHGRYEASLGRRLCRTRRGRTDVVAVARIEPAGGFHRDHRSNGS
ncbi:hypothetical protein ACH4U5_05505 [Streptomyces sp. NPDC020858]|uniref:hypothetical protein n=1 Tax=Streptomyces sp. NPDC020858 TaxID=3365097 RepID=UPI003794983B